jgi:hypothetical protein
LVELDARLGAFSHFWEPFPTSEKAQAQAEQLVRLEESYVIEEVDGDCPRCSSLPDVVKNALDKTRPKVTS